MLIDPSPAPLVKKRSKKSPKGAIKGYRLHFSYKGKQYRRGLIKDKQTANGLQAKVNNLIIQFRNGLIAPDPGVSLEDFIFGNARDVQQAVLPMFVTTLSQLISEYQELSKPPVKAASTCKTERLHLKHLEQFTHQHGYGDPLLSIINIAFFDRYKHFRYAQGAKTDTVRKELGTFQCLFQQGVAHKYLESNIVRDVKRDKSEASSDRYMTLAEIEELRKKNHYPPEKIRKMKNLCYLNLDEIDELIHLAEGQWIHPILLAYANSGMRRGELPRLLWGDVDFEQKILWATSRKQSITSAEKKRPIPINKALFTVLKKQKVKSGHLAWVFQGPVEGKEIPLNTLTHAMMRVIKNTKFEGVGLHVMRRSLGSNLLSKGVPPSVIDKILGHESKAMRARYQHVFASVMRDAMTKLD